ncbi:hypothetical protein M404DRAFT_1005401 [Pisolithus tinctorius Marx 270]|uniref:Uncharacterized protein n=1 Tax=Pisolithus tinctorius Marx 270 TaxID=870435 RepID=A0A0C3NSL3_PISTI|nr:hypothetical protein M404DRAFT_1005401 [Pisolithus tinctorius Marx 270]
MESLEGLAKSLPGSGLEKAEKDLLNNFKAAALSITTLYRSSRNASKRAYNAGYAAACQDLMVMIQQGVSVGGIAPSTSDNPLSGEMSIGRILDWIEARVEAIKAREEEEDEDEEREKERDRTRAGPQTSRTDPNKDTNNASVSFPPHPTASSSKPSDLTSAPTPLTPHSPSISNLTHPITSSPSIPTRSNPLFQRSVKSRPSSARKDISIDTPSMSCLPTPLASSENVSRTPIFPSMHPPFPSIPQGDIAAGTKRRHTVMMMLDSAVPPTVVDVSSSSAGANTVSSTQGNPRRRTRSQRSAHHVQGQAHTTSTDSMEVEEDGRERKRVARR